jgi:hypothetical protein
MEFEGTSDIPRVKNAIHITTDAREPITSVSFIPGSNQTLAAITTRVRFQVCVSLGSLLTEHTLIYRA